jgi:hypothetical protein
MWGGESNTIIIAMFLLYFILWTERNYAGVNRSTSAINRSI